MKNASILNSYSVDINRFGRYLIRAENEYRAAVAAGERYKAEFPKFRGNLKCVVRVPGCNRFFVFNLTRWGDDFKCAEV